MLFAREVLAAWTIGLPRSVLSDVRDDGSDPKNAEHRPLRASTTTSSTGPRATMA